MTRRRRSSLLRWLKGMVAGALIGIACWQMLGVFDGWRRPTLAIGISRWTFVSLATHGGGEPAQPGEDGRHITDLRVHPPSDGKQLVTGQMRTGNEPTKPFEFIAAVPFVIPGPRGDPSAERTYPTVRAYLDGTPSPLPYRYAWWEVAEARAGIAIGVPLVLFGVLLPLTIELLIRFGFLPAPPEPEPEPEPERTPIADASVAPSVAAATADAEPALPEPVLGEATTYEGGVYYPVHIPKSGEK